MKKKKKDWNNMQILFIYKLNLDDKKYDII